MAKLELSWPQINRTPANYCKSTEKKPSLIPIFQLLKNPFFSNNNNNIDVVSIKLRPIELPQRGESAHLSVVTVRFI